MERTCDVGEEGTGAGSLGVLWTGIKKASTFCKKRARIIATRRVPDSHRKTDAGFWIVMSAHLDDLLGEETQRRKHGDTAVRQLRLPPTP